MEFQVCSMNNGNGKRYLLSYGAQSYVLKEERQRQRGENTVRIFKHYFQMNVCI